MSVNRQTFSKEERLCGVNRVDSLFKDGSSFVCYPFRVVYAETSAVEEPSVRFLVSVSKRKLKHAVDRNRVKRLVREAYRLNKHLLADALPDGCTLHAAFIWIPSEILGFEKVNQKMCAALRRLSDTQLEIAVQSDATNNHEHSA